VSGSVVTCLNYAGDNLMLHAAIDVVQPGDIIVCAVTAPSEHGMFGELLATSATAFGVRGVVLDGSARDAAALRSMGFPTWARSISANGTVKNQAGWVNTPVSCGGVVVNPGDVVVADDDGVVVVERAHVEQVAAAARARTEREKGARERLSGKSKSLDNGGRRKMLEDVGAYS
jgi:4-hydroxy-4-methyl-2-oxoglutarate aldolase